jgi:hypothetical protein
MQPRDVAAMQETLLRVLADSPRGFRLGPASDTDRSGKGMSQSDVTILLAYRALVAAGKITETKTHMRAGGVYTSVYRLAEQSTETNGKA